MQVDKIGSHILSKLMYDWRLMDELGVLRTIYLLGSGICASNYTNLHNSSKFTLGSQISPNVL